MNDSVNTNTENLSVASIIDLSILVLISFFAIVYILLILICKTFRENKMNWLTVNVCLATIIVCISQLFFVVFRQSNFLNISCRVQGFLLGMTASEMMYAYCVSSFNRLLAIRYFNKLLFRSTRWLLSTIITGWIIGMISSIPQAFFDGFSCLPNEISIIFKIYSSITILVIPVGIVTGCNLSIFRYIHQISRRVHNANNNNFSRRRDTHVSKIMLLTFFLFVIGWTPIFLAQLFTNSLAQLPEWLSIFLQLLLPSSLLGNIILLIYTNQPVRRYIAGKLTCQGRLLFIVKY